MAVRFSRSSTNSRHQNSRRGSVHHLDEYGNRINTTSYMSGNTSWNNDQVSGFTAGFNINSSAILKLVFGVAIFSAFCKVLQGNEILSFKDIINTLGSYDWNIQIPTIPTAWVDSIAGSGFLDVLSFIIDALIAPFNILIWVINMIISALQFITFLTDMFFF